MEGASSFSQNLSPRAVCLPFKAWFFSSICSFNAAGSICPRFLIPALNSVINRSMQSILFQGGGGRHVLLCAEKGMQNETSRGFPSELNQHKKERKGNIIRWGKRQKKSHSLKPNPFHPAGARPGDHKRSWVRCAGTFPGPECLNRKVMYLGDLFHLLISCLFT